jgi:hypothetical protein
MRDRRSVSEAAYQALYQAISAAVVCGIVFAAAAARAQAQPSPDMQQVLDRLDRLETQNRELMTEIHALRLQLEPAKAVAENPAASQPSPAVAPAPSSAQGETTATQPTPLDERVDVLAQRQAQQDQEKISSDHRLPVTLTGMLLFNSFWNGRGAGDSNNPTIAPEAGGPVDAGATFRQSVIGIKFDGPDIIGGGKITGSAYVDFFGGTGTSLNQLVRLRVASVNAVWKSTTLSVALDKPIFAPREPDSLAQVGVSPLTSAGNLWLWQPQVRVEQRFAFGDQAGLRAQLGVYQTAEGGTGLSTLYASSLASSRPGYEGRFEFWGSGGESRRIEIAPGFHFSDSQVFGQSVPSRIFSVDWLMRPGSWVDFTGTFFSGENVGVVGGLRQGLTVVYDGGVIPVHAQGGWTQVKFHLTPRATLNFYGGQEDDRNSDLAPGGIAKNFAYAGNFMYRIGSNVLASFEAAQVRTTYLFTGTRIFPHYDLAIAYLF